MNREASRALNRINRAFKKALDQPIISLYHYNGCGFFDGGCLLLADALVEWSGGGIKLAAIARTRFGDAIDHWVGEFEVAGEKLYIDANGVQSESSLISYWEIEELREPVMLVASPQYDEAREIPRDAVFSHRIASGILEALGPYSAWEMKLHQAVRPDASPSMA